MNYNLYSIIEDYNYKRKQILRDKKLNIITPSNWMKTKIENKVSAKNFALTFIVDGIIKYDKYSTARY